MKNLQQYSEKINIEEYVANCNKLKQYFLFENLDNDPISMLKIQDEFHILGNFFDDYFGVTGHFFGCRFGLFTNYLDLFGIFEFIFSVKFDFLRIFNIIFHIPKRRLVNSKSSVFCCHGKESFLLLIQPFFYYI